MLYRPVGIVPVLIVSVEDVPDDVGVTADGLNVTEPTPGIAGPSSDNATERPYEPLDEFLRDSVNVTVSPELTATLFVASAVIEKSPETVPTLIGSGISFVVRYGLPACAWIHRA